MADEQPPVYYQTSGNVYYYSDFYVPEPPPIPPPTTPLFPTGPVTPLPPPAQTYYTVRRLKQLGNLQQHGKRLRQVLAFQYLNKL